MPFSPQLTGDRKIDAVQEEIYRVISKLEIEISKKASQDTMNNVLKIVEGINNIVGSKYWRIRPDGYNWVFEYDANLGSGTPNWTVYDTLIP